MNIYCQLNEVVDYLENNLKGNINYQKIAKILGTNLYTAEQLFKLLTGITIKEYVRYRRLTLAAKDLRDKKKAIDIAIIYGYTNPASFSRSFALFHHVTPQQAKKGFITKEFPKIRFDETKYNNITNIDYKIIYDKEFVIYTRKEKTPIKNNTSFIENYWKKIKEEAKEIKKTEIRYGISEPIYDNKKDFYYHIGIDNFWSKSNKEIFFAATWFVITCSSNKAKDIHHTIDKIKEIYLPSLNYCLKDHYYIEIYSKNNVEIWFPLA